MIEEAEESRDQTKPLIKLFRKLFGKYWNKQKEVTPPKKINGFHDTSQETFIEKVLKHLIHSTDPNASLRGDETSSALMERLKEMYPPLHPNSTVFHGTLLKILDLSDVPAPDWIRIIQILRERIPYLTDEHADTLRREIQAMKKRPEKKRKFEHWQRKSLFSGKESGKRERGTKEKRKNEKK